jgi:hypothetical protein
VSRLRAGAHSAAGPPADSARPRDCLHQADEFQLPGNCAQVEPRHRDRQTEAPRSRAARVDVDDSAALAAAGLVRVAAHDRLEPGRGGIEIERVHVMEHIDGGAAGLRHRGLGQRFRPRAPIDISAHRDYGRDGAQSVQYFRPANVAGVYDQVRAFQRAQGLVAQQAVSIGDQPGNRRRRPYGSSTIGARGKANFRPA